MKGYLRVTLAVMLCVAVSMVAVASEMAYRVVYDGGSLQGVKPGTKIKMYIEPATIRFADGSSNLITVPSSSVTEISYGQDVHRRVGAAIGVAVVSLGIGALLALSKSKKHYVGITWAMGTQKGGFAMQCGKGDYRGILAGLEGVTGKKAVDSDAMNVKN